MSHDPHADPDMLRHTAPCPHTWLLVDVRENFWRCKKCGKPFDDEPPDAA